jgi:type IV secretory pathway VirB2 component (pilin)
MKKLISKAKTAVLLASVSLAAPMAFAEASTSPVDQIKDAVVGALSGLAAITTVILAVAPVGIGIAIAFKVFGKSKQAVNKA